MIDSNISQVVVMCSRNRKVGCLATLTSSNEWSDFAVAGELRRQMVLCDTCLVLTVPELLAAVKEAVAELNIVRMLKTKLEILKNYLGPWESNIHALKTKFIKQKTSSCLRCNVFLSSFVVLTWPLVYVIMSYSHYIIKLLSNPVSALCFMKHATEFCQTTSTSSCSADLSFNYFVLHCLL